MSETLVKGLLYGLFLYMGRRYCDTGFRSRDQVFLKNLGEVLPKYLPLDGSFSVLAVGEIEVEENGHGNSTNAAGTDITPDDWAESDDVRAGRPAHPACADGA